MIDERQNQPIQVLLLSDHSLKQPRNLALRHRIGWEKFHYC